MQSLRQIADIASTSEGAAVTFEAIEHASITLPPESCDQLHRITQDALNNALKHRHAKNIKVIIQIELMFVKVKVQYDCRVLRVANESQSEVALDGIRQRASTIGALISVKPRRNGGACMTCECPQQASNPIRTN